MDVLRGVFPSEHSVRKPRPNKLWIWLNKGKKNKKIIESTYNSSMKTMLNQPRF